MSFSDFWVIIFFEQAEPQSEGSRHTDPGVKLLPACTCLGTPTIFIVHARTSAEQRRTASGAWNGAMGLVSSAAEALGWG